MDKLPLDCGESRFCDLDDYILLSRQDQCLYKYGSVHVIYDKSIMQEVDYKPIISK